MLSEQQQRIMGYFIEEAKDHLNTIEQGLVNLQGTINDPEMVHEVFRAAHSVKGGAAMLGLSSIQRTAHRLEDCFKVLKECPHLPVDQKLETLFLRVYDTLHELVEQLQGPFGLTEDKAQAAMANVEPVFAELGQHLDVLVNQVGASLPEDVDLSSIPLSSPPVSAPPQVVQPVISEESAFQFIFQNDVPARLREMLQLFKQSEHPDSREQLQSICRSLSQPGEQFNLPNWCELLATAQRAIGNEENTYRTLAPVIIKDIKRAQEFVLSGRAANVSASEDLLNLLPPDLPPVLESIPEDDTADFADLLAIQAEAEVDDVPLTDTNVDLDAGDPFAALLNESPDAESESLNSDAGSENWLGDLAASVNPEEPSPSADTSNLDFDLDAALSSASEDLTSDPADPGLMESSTEKDNPLSSDRSDRQGPAVGIAELNSLADLFEGELSDLGLTWQEEEVLDADTPRSDVAESSSPDSSEEFSDLFLEDQSDFDSLMEDEGEEDLSGLLNAISLQESIASPMPTGSSPNPDPTSEVIPDDTASFFGEQFDNAIGTGEDSSDFATEGFDNLDELFLSIEGEDLTAGQAGLPATSLEAEAAEFQHIFASLDEVDSAPDAASRADEDSFDTLFNLSESEETELSFDSAAEPAPIANAEASLTSSVHQEGSADSLMDELFANIDEPTPAEIAVEVAAEISLLPAENLETEEPDLDAGLNLAEKDESVDLSEADTIPLEGMTLMEDTPVEVESLEESPDHLSSDFWSFDASSDSALIAQGDALPPEYATDDRTQHDDPTRIEALDLTLEPEEFSAPDLWTDDAEPIEEADTSGSANQEMALGEFNLDEYTGDAGSMEAENPSESFRSELFETELSELNLEDNLGDLFSNGDANDSVFADGDFAGDEPQPDLEAIGSIDLDSESSFFDSEPNTELTPESIADSTLGIEGDIEDDIDLPLSSETNTSEDENPVPSETENPTLAEEPDFFEREEFDLTAVEALLLEEELQAELQSNLVLESTESGLTDTESASPDRFEDGLPGLAASDLDSSANSELDEFADLEAMLEGEPAAIADVPIAPESPHDTDEFADLEALLGNEAPGNSAVPEVTLPDAVANQDDEFGDLEALLQDADQKLGVGSSSVRGATSAAVRRPSRRNVIADQTMRVSVKHLDNLNNLVGEMVVNRNSLEQTQERLRQFLDNLLYQVQQLSDVGQRMRDLYERSLLESSLLSSRRSYLLLGGTGLGSSQNHHATGASFDALEMDKFTGFHTLSQEMIELIVRVRESASDIDFVVEESDQVTRNFRQITTQLQEGLTRSRMVPFAQTADRLPRGVRDNAIKYGKQAELVIEGRDTLIDKMIVEQLYDPMTHLVNNAIAHGIETPDVRTAAGKSPVGRITIRAFHQGNQTVISVSDDGAGINPETVKAKALAKGLITPSQAGQLSRLDIYDLLFHHGFSTADQVDDLRGRGVGLDVVRSNLSEIRGVITIDSSVGKGTTFTIRLPLTLSISKALCCISNRARIAFPMDGVEDMLDVPKDRIQTDDQGRSCIQWRDTLLPFQPLADLLKYNRVLGRGSVYGGNQEEDVLSLVVLRSAGNYLALQIDQVLGEQEIVIKQLEGPVPKPIGVAGATVLGDGRIMPIADVLELIDLSQGRIRREANNALWEMSGELAAQEAASTKTEPTVLIVDDSITVRELLSMTFNKVGYRVEQARDGQEAWEKLRSGLPCDLVFCDIEMPRMDGLELLSRMQKDPHLSEIPIAMLTSRGADRHRQMAVQLGAKGYFTKPYLEEVLLDAAQRMLKGEVLVAANPTS